MSFLSSTVGVVWRAATGNVDPWTLKEIKTETRGGIAKASAGADPGVIAERQKRAEDEIDGFLRQVDAHPDQSGLRIPGLGVLGSPDFLKKIGKLVNVALLLLVAGAGLWFVVKIRSVFKGG